MLYQRVLRVKKENNRDVCLESPLFLLLLHFFVHFSNETLIVGLCISPIFSLVWQKTFIGFCCCCCIFYYHIRHSICVVAHRSIIVKIKNFTPILVSFRTIPDSHHQTRHITIFQQQKQTKNERQWIRSMIIIIVHVVQPNSIVPLFVCLFFDFWPPLPNEKKNLQLTK